MLLLKDNIKMGENQSIFRKFWNLINFIFQNILQIEVRFLIIEKRVSG